ncbi:MAG: aldehyde ferredoxin oxidoreductase C-terminal domain-containing protein [Granulosicoccaceae bacterium]
MPAKNSTKIGHMSVEQSPARTHLEIDLKNQRVERRPVEGDELISRGRHLIAKTLLDCGAADADPLSPANPLIFSAGPLAGTNFSNANRISVGCKSPLTGGIKEANAGGTMAFNLGQLELAGFTLHGACSDWTLIYIDKEGELSFHDAAHLVGRANTEIAAELHQQYGKKASVALCSQVGEYLGLMAGIAFSDTDQRPTRFAARGGVGAVMGSKKVKAIVVEANRMPPFADRKKLMGSVKQYNRWLDESPAIQTLKDLGTASVGDYTNEVGGLPTLNFSAGRQDPQGNAFQMGGAYIRELNMSRGGQPTHACMPGCQIKCSNVYFDAEGKELASPIEYETLGLMGTNCGLSNPDDLARVNAIANDLGVDTIEAGAMLAVLMEAGLAEFGDVDFMIEALDVHIRQGTEQGKIWAQGTGAVGKHYNVKRVPVIKNQAISAYDPRVIEVTGLSMMTTAQGADHTTGNAPSFECAGKSLDELMAASIDMQVLCAAADSLGLCVFGRAVTNEKLDFMIQTFRDAYGVELDNNFYRDLGQRTLELEQAFNKAAGFSDSDDDLPSFFYEEELPPTGKTARFHGEDANASPSRWWATAQ